MKNNRAILTLFLPALLVALALLLAGCKDFSFYGVLGDRIDNTPLQIAPAAATLATGSTLDFAATGGTPPYTFAVTSGPGSFIDANTYSAASPGVATVQVTDGKGRIAATPATVTVTVGAALQVAPLSVTVVVGGSVTFYAFGGTPSPSYTYTISTNNSGAPAMTNEVYTAGMIGGVTDTVQLADGFSTPVTATVNVVSASIANVDYRVSATNFVPASGTGGQAIPGSYSFTIRNDGTDTGTQPISWWVFISADNLFGDGDTLLASGSTSVLPAGGGGTEVVSLSPTTTWPAVGGNRWLFVLVASGDDLNSTNNHTGGSPAAVVLAPPDVNYVLGNLTPGSGTIAGGPLSGTFELTNSGASGGTQPVSWTAYVSTDAAWDAGDLVADAGSLPALASGFTQLGIAFGGRWPAASGSYYLIVRASASDEPPPADTTGNTLGSGAVAVSQPPIDYIVTTVSSAGFTYAGGPLTGSFQYRNNLSAAGSQPVHWIAYVSTDSTLDPALDPVADSGDAAALGGSTTSAAVSFDGTWPAGAGNRFLFVAVSAGDDTNPGNNTNTSGAVPVTLPPIDYIVTTVSSTGATQAGGPLAGSFQYRNSGTNPGSQLVHWIAYVSTDSTWDAADPVIDSGDEAALPGSTTSAAVSFDGTWPMGAGSRFLFVAVSAGDEVNTTNNRAGSGAVAVTALPVDYSGSVSNTGQKRAGGALNGSITITNDPAAAGTRTVFWNVYASAGNSTIELGVDKLVASGSFPALAAGGTFGPSAFASTWPSATGDYYLVADIQAEDDIDATNDHPFSGPIAVGATDYSGAVAHSGGAIAGAAFAFTLDIGNIGGAYALAGSQDLYWNVYASRGDTAISADDKVVGSGVLTGGLSAGGSWASGTLNNSWPTATGTYYLIADIFAGDDANTANNRPASASITVAAPPAANVNYGGAVAHTSGTTAGAAFDGTLTITNGGGSAGTQSVIWNVYASLGNATLEPGDTLVASGSQAPLGAGGSSGVLAFNDTWPAAAGTYYLVADIQAADDVNLTNNQPASGAVAVSAPPAPAVDYSGALTAGAPTRAGASFTASLTITNGPAAPGSSTVYWSVYASPGNATYEPGVDILVGSGSLTGLPAGGSSGPLPINSSWPAATGAYYLVARILADDDTNTANNAPAGPMVNVGKTDYSGAVVHGLGTTAGAAVTGTISIGNISGVYALAGSQGIFWNVYASLGDTVISPDDKVVGSGTIPGGLGAGVSTGPISYTNTWPSTAGTYYLIADIFAGDDADTSNNKPFSPGVAVAAPPTANIDYSGIVQHLAGTTAGEAFNGTLTISNEGLDNGVQNISWSVYASLNNATIGVGDSLVASGTIIGGLLAGGNSGALVISNTWPATAGTYYLVADIQASDDINSTNNQPASAAVTVTPSALLPDYTGTVTAGTPKRAGGPFTASLTVNNTAAATGSRTVHWSVYASLGNTTIETGVDKLVGSGSFPGLSPLGSSGALPISSSWPAGTGDYYLVAQIQADDDPNLLNNTPFSPAVSVGATDYSGAVTHLSGTTAGAGFTFSLTINNAGGTYALAGSADLYWNVYASLGDSVISVDDKVVGSGIIPGGLSAGGNFASGVLTNTWPSTPGAYYLVADIYAGDDANSANNRPNTSVPVAAPLPPDYAASFTTDPAWSALVGSAIAGQIRIQNISANLGLKPIAYSVYRSADKVLGGDTLLVTGSQSPLAAGTSVDVPMADGDTWPAGGQFWYLIATISAADDVELSNNTVVSHPIAAADGRYVEGAENNGDSGPTPPAFAAVSATGLTLALNGTIALEGTMDAYVAANPQYDTYRFVTGAGIGGVSMKVRWQTGYDDVDLYLWDENKGQVSSLATDVDSEPAGAPTLNIIGLAAGANYYAGLNFWLANNTSGSAGKPYVVLIKGNP